MISPRFGCEVKCKTEEEEMPKSALYIRNLKKSDKTKHENEKEITAARRLESLSLLSERFECLLAGSGEEFGPEEARLWIELSHIRSR